MKVVRAILNLIYQVFMAFPKFFKPFLAAIPYIGVILKFLPEIISLIKTISYRLDRGETVLSIKYRLKAVDKAFSNEDRIQAAKDLQEAIRT